MSIRGPKRGRVSPRLPRAAVPWAACVYIKQVFSPGYQPPIGKNLKDFEPFKGIENFAFNVVAHILGAAGTRLARRGHHFIHVDVFPALGARTGKYTQQDADSLYKAGVITPASRPSRKTGKATTYRLHPSIRSAMAASDDDRLFYSWSDFDRCSPVAARAVPVTTIDPSFHRVVGHDPDLEAVILAMQAEGMHFDRRSCRAFLNSATTGLTGVQHAHFEAFVEGLHAGPNYPTFALTASGRVQTIGKCCLQNVPRVIRRFWYPPVGYRFLDFDFRAQEPHILAKLSRDGKLLADLGGDLYEQVVQSVGRPSALVVTRDTAKTIVNGIFNGGGDFQLAKEAFESEWSKPSPDERQFIRDVLAYLKARYPAMGWLDGAAQRIADARQAVTEGRLVRRLAPKDGKASDYAGLSASDKLKLARKQGISHRIQGSGADIMRHLLKILPARLGDKGRIALPMHDGLVVVARETELLAVSRIVRRAMDESVEHFLPGLRIPKKATIGWREKTDLKRTSNVVP